MPRVIEFAEPLAPISLAECADRLAARGFDPADEDSLLEGSQALKALGSNSTFLGDLLIENLKAGYRDEAANAYGPQVVMLANPGDDCFLRANIWPSREDAVLSASGGDAFAFAMPHDHNFSFLTLGYFGPGYWSDYYEFDYEDVAGWTGEPVDLRFVERARLSPGKVMLYRAHRDVHVQHPADALSVSINVMHTAPHQNWFDQYSFDTATRTVSGIVTQGASEVALRLAVALGIVEGCAVAQDFARSHPSDRMRLAAWEALAAGAADHTARDAVWRQAEVTGNRMIAGEARRRRALQTA